MKQVENRNISLFISLNLRAVYVDTLFSLDNNHNLFQLASSRFTTAIHLVCQNKWVSLTCSHRNCRTVQLEFSIRASVQMQTICSRCACVCVHVKENDSARGWKLLYAIPHSSIAGHIHDYKYTHYLNESNVKMGVCASWNIVFIPKPNILCWHVADEFHRVWPETLSTLFLFFTSTIK